MKTFKKCLGIFFIVFSVVLLISAAWAIRTFDHISLEEIIFQLLVPMKGANTSYFLNYFLYALIPIVLICFLLILIYLKEEKCIINFKIKLKKKNKDINLKFLSNKNFYILILLLFTIWYTFNNYDVITYLDNQFTKSSFIEDNYVDPNDVKLDLGGMVKGYVTELVGNYLEEENIHSYIINAGGNVKVGKAYNKDAFIVGITDPNNKEGVFTKVKVNNLSVVTSGNYQRYCDLDEVSYNHIINPKTKYPSEYMDSVTVVSKDSLLADIYSTYLFLLPVEEGITIVNNTSDIEVIFLLPSLSLSICITISIAFSI